MLPAILPLVLVLDAAFAIAWAVDFLRTPRPDRLVLEREVVKVVGLSRSFEREIRVSGGRPGLVVELHEEFPDCFVPLARCVEGRSVEVPSEDPSGGPDVLTLDDEGEGRAIRVYRGEMACATTYR